MDRPQSSKVTKVLRSKKKDEQLTTLTQMVKRKVNKEKADIDDLIDEQDALDMLNDEENLVKDDSSDSNSDNEDKTTEKKKQNTNLFLSAFVGGAKQRISLIKLLFATKPRYVILYDSELWFVRQLEVYQTIHYSAPMRIYFLMYKNSCEEQKYLTSIRTEKESFEILIKEKAVIFYLLI